MVFSEPVGEEIAGREADFLGPYGDLGGNGFCRLRRSRHGAGYEGQPKGTQQQDPTFFYMGTSVSCRLCEGETYCNRRDDPTVAEDLYLSRKM